MSDKNDKGSKDSFWATMPGWLTAIAGILTAIGGLITVLFAVGLLRLPSSPTSATPTTLPTIASSQTQPTEVPAATTQDTLSISSISPAVGVPLKSGQAVEFEINLHYTLKSADQAILGLFIEEFPDSAKGCVGSDHQTSGGTYVPISRGESDVLVRLKWFRDPGKLGEKDLIASGAGYLGLGANFWTAMNGNPDRLIQSFGLFPDYCYAFTP